ncbi:hypothetical protein L0664_04400 [Octadecabacter sp. G9-8]|uniref:Uncharacterized protein n=1 Tax=Octadecabacter dasysiphoniae TaxID=2909341 RepID=A0ABS9CV67_9RHOB|nr:hypothetical protein [Octadecabacter dasysiphoniae]MCF2870300.1 hypothetical protein [Octadecabacter dasysiphoniae]
MTGMPMTSDSHRRKVMSLRLSTRMHVDARQVAISRAVLETLQNPVVARAVARGLRFDALDKA